MDPVELAVAIAILTTSVGGVTVLGMLARAAIKKWSQQRQSLDSAEVHELRNAITQLAAEVSELHERLDFTERVLTSQRGPQRLEEGE